MKKIIVNADDFGLSSAVNRGVVTAWREGILTSASLMVGGAAFQEAVELARENPGLQVGLHLTLIQGRGVASHTGFPNIVDRDGYFSTDPVHAGMRYFFLEKLRRQLYREIEAQIEAFLATGLPLSHLDGHLNVHMHPVVFDILSQLMPRYNITSFRLTCERLGPELTADRHRIFGKTLEAVIFSSLAARCRPRLHQMGIMHASEVKGLFNSGRMTAGYLLKTLEGVQPGITEIYFHPGHRPDHEVERWMPDYRHEEELAALTSPLVREKVRREGIVLCNYRGEEKRDV